MKINFPKVVIHSDDLKTFTPGGNRNFFSLLARKEALACMSCIALGYAESNIYRKLFGFPSRHQNFYDSWRGIYINKDTMQQEREEILKRFKKDPLYLDKIAKKCESDGEKIFKFGLKLKKTDFTKKSDNELKKIAWKSLDSVVWMAAYLLFPLSIQGYLEETIRNGLKGKIKDGKVDEYFGLLAVPIKGNLGYFEQIGILKLASLYKKTGKITEKIKNEINQYLYRYDILGTKYGIGNLWTENDAEQRIKYLALQNPEEKLKHLKELPIIQQKKINEIFKEINADSAFKKMVRIARAYIFMRTYRTDMLSGFFGNLFPLFSEIAKRNNLERNDVLECLQSEIVTFNFPNADFIRKRAKEVVVMAENGKLYWTHGEMAKRVIENVKQTIKTVVPAVVGIIQKTQANEIKGTIANKGMARGTARVILDNTQLNKVREGDILVASMTTPDFVPAMEKAAAFVTDEGGILCHAAIVSREMQKPCIIGTKIATKVLKDGDLVEVDADRGMVRILKKK